MQEALAPNYLARLMRAGPAQIRARSRARRKLGRVHNEGRGGIETSDAGKRLQAEIKPFHDARKDRRIQKGYDSVLGMLF